MHAPLSLKLFLGSVAAYALGACGSALVSPSTGSSTDAGAEREARAQQVVEDGGPSTVTATEGCSQTYAYRGAAFVYAEHAFPGLSASRLASVQAVAHLTTNAAAPMGYEQSTVGGVLVRDGYAAVGCGSQSMPSFDSVTFTLIAP